MRIGKPIGKLRVIDCKHFILLYDLRISNSNLKVMCHTDVVAPIVTNRFPYSRRTSSFFDENRETD